MTDVVTHFLIFTVVAVAALLAPLLLGYLVRPRIPTAEKETAYECGEPPIGSSYIQFDLRFYVVALLFIIFDVEVVFFFPWTLIFGGTMQLADERLPEPTRITLSERLLSEPAGTLAPQAAVSATSALNLGWVGLCDLLVFFGVLLVGFAYVWKRGDLDWVRAVTQKAKQPAPARPLVVADQGSHVAL
jgi:NADH-quinone oxidoreductase subunit A